MRSATPRWALPFILLVILSMLSGCISKTEHGPCIGAFDDEDPALIYRASARNVVIGLLLFETVMVPAYVIVEQTKCPYARRVEPESKPHIEEGQRQHPAPEPAK